MELYVIIVSSFILLIVLLLLARITPSKLKRIKEIGKDESLNKLTNNLPKNEEICKDMLSMLENENVKIKLGNENSEASLYIVASNSILIANINKTFTRVQTIAHECLHSIQDKALLWFNFIFSNMYIIYFLIITILALFNIISQPVIYAIILIMMSIVLYCVRSYLEIDAMTKAKFLSEKYMNRNLDKISKENIGLVINKYDEMNNIGIKLTYVSLMCRIFN